MTRRISPPTVFLALLGIFVLCYASALRSSYGFTDDYSVLMGAVRGTPDVNVAIAGGRPAYAFLLRVFFAPLREVVAERFFEPFAGLTDIVPAALGEEVVVHGAIALARRKLG